MLRLWSRAAQAQSTCRCVSCLSTTSGALASRTASAASKRRLRIGNSVTALYTSIFAAAALADAQAKDQRRLEWKEKIAAVREEVNELVDEEQRLLEALASRRKPRMLSGTLHARQYRPFQMTAGVFSSRPGQLSLRSYHSEAVADNLGMNPHEKSEADASTGPGNGRESLEGSVEEVPSTSIDNNLREPVTDAVDDDTPNEADLLPETLDEMDLGLEIAAERARSLAQDERGFIYEHNTIPTWVANDGARMRAIHTVALTQLAIRFLLRPTIAHDYLGHRAQYDTDRSQPRLRTQQLLFELRKLRHKMMLLKTKKTVDLIDLVPRSHDPQYDNAEKFQTLKVDRQIRTDIEDFLRGTSSLDELLIKLAHSLTNAPNPNRAEAFKYMLLAFTRTHQADLCDLVLKAILPNKFPLTPSLILAILTHHYKTKDLKGFDLFLEMIRGDSYPVDMGNLAFYKRVVVNGMEITVPPPPGANAIVYATLIMACLRFDQPDRADAYLQHARSIGYMDSWPTLNAYLKFYTIRGDWPKGLHTMKRALAFIASSTEHPETLLERLISLMVRFCDTCQQPDISEAIIVAAVNSGFDWQFAVKQTDLQFPADVEFQRWKKARDSSTEMPEKATWEKSYAFVNAMSEQLNNLPQPDAESARRWQTLMETYAQQVLSSAVSGAPTEHKESKNLIAKQENEPTSQSAPEGETTPPPSYNDIAQAHQQEISSLKDEVSQLKQMVFELTQTASNKPTAPPEPAAPEPAAPEPAPATTPRPRKSKFFLPKTYTSVTSPQISIKYRKP